MGPRSRQRVACIADRTVTIEQQNGDLFDVCLSVVFAGAPLALPRARHPDRDHLWEFLSAAIYSQFGVGVQANLTGDGVDVRGLFRRRRWGIECKVLYTKNVDARIDRIIDGVKQIEADAAIDAGVVAVNVTNCVDHTPFEASLTTEHAALRTNEETKGLLARAVRAIALETMTSRFHERFYRDKLNQARTKCRGIIWVAQTVAKTRDRLDLFTAQVSVLRTPSAVGDRVFANRYYMGWSVTVPQAERSKA